MRLYPDVPARRTAAIASDAALLLALILFAWLGLKVHGTVDELASLGRGVQGAGSAISDGFGAAADAVSDTPVVGGDLADGLRGAGEGSGGEVAAAGRSGEEAVHDLATLLGVLTFGIPAALLLSRALPPRIAQVRRLTAASRVLAVAPTGERGRLVAMRAAFGLPYGDLLRYTADPLGDLEAGRYDGLLRAAYDEVGLTAPATSPGSPS